MRLIFEGHNEVYAVEQTLMSLLPDERPTYGEGESDWARVCLTGDEAHAQAVTEMHYHGRCGTGSASADLNGSAYTREGQRRRVLQMSFFKAAQAATGAA